jgi:acetyl esterase/lipase
MVPMSTTSTQRPLPRRTGRFGVQEWEVYDAWSTVESRADVTVVLVHGGLWQVTYDRAHLRPLGMALARDGWPVASVEYARVGMPGGGWPGTGQSVLAAIEAVAADPELPSRLVAVGHSAGGQLAVWAASDGRCPALAGVVSLAGVLDLRLADSYDLGSGAVRALMGSAPTQCPQAWADADPRGARLDVPAVLLHGAADTLVPSGVSASYLRSRGAGDATCRLEIVPDCDHFGIIGPGHAAYHRVLAAIDELAAGASDGADRRP